MDVDHEIKLEAECFCKKVQIQCTGKPTWVCNCHCTICQRCNAAPFVCMAAWMDPTKVVVTAGQELIRELKTSDNFTRTFCGACGSALMSTSHIPEYPFKDISVPLFKRDDTGRIKHLDLLLPTSHIFYPNRMVNLVDNLPKWDSYPDVGKPLKVDAKGDVVQDDGQEAKQQAAAAAPADASVVPASPKKRKGDEPKDG